MSYLYIDYQLYYKNTTDESGFNQLLPKTLLKSIDMILLTLTLNIQTKINLRTEVS